MTGFPGGTPSATAWRRRASRRRDRRGGVLRQADPEVPPHPRDLSLDGACGTSRRSCAPFRSGCARSCRMEPRILRCARALRHRCAAAALLPEHHESHAASAFYPSPFAEAAVLTMDGVGEWATATIGVGEGASLRLLERARFPAFARAALLGLHLLHGIPGELGRVQGDGPRAVRRSAFHPADPRRADRPEGRWFVPAEHAPISVIWTDCE